MSGASIWTGNTTQVSTANADNTKLEQRFAPTEGQSLFVLTNFSYAVGTHSLEVFINGVRQSMGVDFVETSTTSFTVTGGVEATDVVDATGIVGTSGATLASASAAAANVSAAAAAASLASISALALPALPLTRANGGLGQIVPAPVAGKVLGSTDGVTFSMVTPGIAGATVITANTALTAATIGQHLIAMVAMGSSVTLPDATTLSVGPAKCYLDNTKGGYPVGIRDSAGVLIMAIAAGGEAIVSLRDNSTAAGVWSVTGSNLEPGLITIDNTFSSTYASTVFAPFVALDANTSIHFAALATGFAAFVVDNLGKVITTPVTVSATGGHIPQVAFKINATQAIVFYTGANAQQNAAVITLSGASPSYALSVGAQTQTTIAMSGLWEGENSVGVPRIAQLTGSLYLCTYGNTGNPGTSSVVAISVAGAVVTIGAPVSLGSVANDVVGANTTYALTATTALVLCKINGVAPYDNKAVVVSVAGTVCTLGASVTLTGCNSSSAGVPSSCLLSPTKALVVDDGSAATLAKVISLSIAGNVITIGTALQVEFSSGVNLTHKYTDNNANRYNPHLFALSANTALFWYFDVNGISRAVVLTEAAGIITAGAILYRSISSAGATVSGSGKIYSQGSSEFVSIRGIASVTNGLGGAYLVPCKISGATITQGAGRLAEYCSSIYPENITVVKTSSGKYVATGVFFNGSAGFTGTSGAAVFSSNGDAINYQGKLAVPALFTVSVLDSQPVVASNRICILGSTGYGTTIGVATYQLRLLNVEIAA